MLKADVPAVVLGDSEILTIGFARSLAGSGVNVYCATSGKNTAAFSKYVKKCFIVPDIEEDATSLTSFLERFHREHAFSVVFPGTDNVCLNLASLRPELEDKVGDGFQFVMPEKEVVETFANKRKFYHSLSRQEIPFPLTYFPEDLEDVARISREVDYPVFVKPSLAQVFMEMFGTKGFVARSKEELIEDYKLADQRNVDAVIQEIIPGPDSEVFGLNAYFDKKRDPQGLFGYRRIRGSPIGFGVGSLVESVPLSDISEVKNVVDYLHGLGYYGLADAEFKRDRRDGRFKLLEVNPRLWLQSSFPPKCGINLNLMAYLDAIDGPPIHDKGYRVGVKWLYPSYDLVSAAKMLMGKQLSFSEWVISLRLVCDRAYSAADDLFPWVLSPLQNIRQHSQRHENLRHILKAIFSEGMGLFY